METNQLTETTNYVIDLKQLLTHWQGHRLLTRKVIKLFPEDQLFNFSIGGMRTFSEMLLELIDLASGGIVGIANNDWKSMNELYHIKGNPFKTKNEFLEKWDEVTKQIDTLWPTVSIERFQEVVLAFGQYEGPVYSTLLYFIDNEIHHRGQAYVYLRALGITPPPFWERN